MVAYFSWFCGSGTCAGLRQAVCPCQRASLSGIQSWLGWAGRSKKALLTCLRPQLERLEWLMASLHLCSCGSPASVQFTKAAVLQGWVFSWRTPGTYQGQFSIWKYPIGQNRSHSQVQSQHTGTHRCVNTRKHNWEPSGDFFVWAPFSSVLDSSFQICPAPQPKEHNGSIWDAVINTPLEAVFGFHPGKYFLIHCNIWMWFFFFFFKLPWSLIYSDK